MLKHIFTKFPLSYEQQLDLLLERGLHVTEPEQALFYLKFIGYYRLSGYARYYYTEGSTFQPGIGFEHILNLYRFDRELRLLALDAIEKIEVAARTVISDTLANRYHAHWYLDQSLFAKAFRYTELIRAIEKDTHFDTQGGYHPIFKHYYHTYHEPKYPPSWMLAEGLTLGTWSKLFAFLKQKTDKQAVASAFGLPAKVLQSWLHSLSHLRNTCAHHGILWNRHFHTLPMIPQHLTPADKSQFQPNHLVKAQLAMLQVWLQTVAPGSSWSNRLYQLFQKYSTIPLKDTGFEPAWFHHAFWCIEGHAS